MLKENTLCFRCRLNRALHLCAKNNNNIYLTADTFTSSVHSLTPTTTVKSQIIILVAAQEFS